MYNCCLPDNILPRDFQSSATICKGFSWLTTDLLYFAHQLEQGSHSSYDFSYIFLFLLLDITLINILQKVTKEVEFLIIYLSEKCLYFYWEWTENVHLYDSSEENRILWSIYLFIFEFIFCFPLTYIYSNNINACYYDFFLSGLFFFFFLEGKEYFSVFLKCHWSIQMKLQMWFFCCFILGIFSYCIGLCGTFMVKILFFISYNFFFFLAKWLYHLIYFLHCFISKNFYIPLIKSIFLFFFLELILFESNWILKCIVKNNLFPPPLVIVNKRLCWLL